MDTNFLLERLKNNNDQGLYVDDWESNLDYYTIYALLNVSDATPAELNFLGFMHTFGKGTEFNPVKGVSLYEKAASAGNAYAKHNLGRAYQLGRGVLPDIRRAIDYYLEAKELGLSDIADFELAQIQNIEVLLVLLDEIKTLEKMIKDLREENTHLKYKPNGIGYFEAKKEFEKLAEQSSFVEK